MPLFLTVRLFQEVAASQRVIRCSGRILTHRAARGRSIRLTFCPAELGLDVRSWLRFHLGPVPATAGKPIVQRMHIMNVLPFPCRFSRSSAGSAGRTNVAPAVWRERDERDGHTGQGPRQSGDSAILTMRPRAVIYRSVIIEL